MKNVVFVMLSFLICNQAFASFIGNDVVNRNSLDGASNINFVDTTLIFDENAIITSWDIFAGRENSEFALQVFRSTGTTNEFILVGQNYFSAAGSLGLIRFDIPLAEQISVQAGDVIGWWFGNGRGVIDYNGGSDRVSWKYENGTFVNVGDTVLLSSGGNREYSIQANYSVVPEPSVFALFFLSILGAGFAARKRKV